MSTQEIADRLTDLCRQGKFKTAVEELYAQDAVSIEPHATPAFDKETKGLEAILAKGEKWGSMAETKEITVSDPLVTGNVFALTMRMSVVMKDRGPMDISELCVYQAKDDKIVSEQFFM
jgi:hypothetical protein